MKIITSIKPSKEKISWFVNFMWSSNDIKSLYNTATKL